MAATSVEEMFQRGIELFNQGRFFDAHEAWEQSWLRSGGEEKIFYQGLIQAAAAILHVQRGNPSGARSLWQKAGSKLAGLPADYRSIDLEQLRSGLAEFFDRALSGQTTWNPPPRIRRL
jgi:uncharacterized protein